MINPRPLLQIEGVALFFLSIVAYGWNHGGWGLLVLLFLIPDVSMIGYLANARIGGCSTTPPTRRSGHSFWGHMRLRQITVQHC